MLLDQFYTVDTGRRLTQAELATLLGVADRRQVLRYRTEGMRAQTVPFLRLKGVVDGVFPVDALIENVEIAK